MKINSNPISKLLGTYNSNKSGKKDGVANAKGNSKDSITISPQAKDFQMALKAITNAPDIRTDKVEEISRAISSGTYNVSKEDVAEKILQGSVFDIRA